MRIQCLESSADGVPFLRQLHQFQMWIHSTLQEKETENETTNLSR